MVTTALDIFLGFCEAGLLGLALAPYALLLL